MTKLIFNLVLFAHSNIATGNSIIMKMKTKYNLSEDLINFIGEILVHGSNTIKSVSKKWIHIGGGRFSEVFGTTVNFVDDTSMPVVIKLIKKKHFADNENYEISQRACNEAVSMNKLRHTSQDSKNHYIAEILGAYNTDEYFVILENRYEQTLQDRIEVYGILSHRKGQIIARQLIESIEYIHSHNYLHRDLKPADIFLELSEYRSDIKNIRIGDFGLCKLVEKAEENTDYSSYFLSEFQAPEIDTGEMCNNKCDIWSLGAIIYYMLSGSAPFKGTNLEQIKENKKKNTPCYDNGYFLDDEVNFIKKCLEPDPEKRASIAELKKEPYFLQDYDNDAFD
ncbi:hypothetical protein TRFO_03024 [Tritrichomonas foetus]|uniref:Protein kinase domain-containing protein n=1 Tax=Tritrichomonas foetus TaxID=1144522 RepID=A0A1J4KU08_9EUKA|nr:hypothetical protein TRFO_03024 [Tritrichomonas foetus]|eukprot:OHT14751.1 hypothetical protein TRFO_03024 [Tritrichomonas foetus]